jgi:hypothetical protein
MEYLDFELPIKDLEDQKNVSLSVENQMLMLQILKQINKKLIGYQKDYL